MMFRRPIKEVNAEFVAEEKYLDSIQRTVRESCLAASMSPKDVSAVLLAVDEGATNLIRHAYLYEKGIIRLRIVTYRKMIVFSLIDFGRSFQPDASGTLDLPRLVESGRKGGLGFYMIQKIMDSVEYISTAGLNELRMIKRIKASRPAGRPFRHRMFTLRVKFSVWTFIIMSIIIGGSYYYIDRQTSQQMYRHNHEQVRALTKTIADQAAGYIMNRRSDVEFDELIVSYRRANPELRLLVLTDQPGLIRAHSDDIRNIRKPYRFPGRISESAIGVPQPLDTAGDALSYLIMPIKTGEKTVGMAHVVYSSSQVRDKLWAARKNSILLTVVLVLFGILGIYLLSNYFVSPILRINRRIRRFTAGGLETELPLEGADEFFEISRAFNQMMTRLSQDKKNIVEREKMAKEIELASEIQKALLPLKLPRLPKLEIDAFYRAASIVGGDLYDIFRIDGDRYCLTVADVSGKGVPASLVMSMLRTVIQIYASEGDSAKDTMIKVSRYLEGNIPPGMFVTVFLVIYDADSNSINFVSAGHNPMLYYRASKKQLTKINPRGMPLGMPLTLGDSFDESLEEVTLALRDGDVFLIYTDGVTEATDREGSHYGMDRLLAVVGAQLSGDGIGTVASLTKTIVNELDDFTGFVKANDDIAFIIARSNSSDSDGGSSEERQTEPEKVDVTSIADSPPKPPLSE